MYLRLELSEAVLKANIAIDDLIEYLDKLGFNIPLSKSHAMIFTRKRKIDLKAIQIRIKDQQIPVVKKTIFLGLIMDHKLKWQERIEYIEQKVEKRMNLLRSLCGVHWGEGTQ